jgi:hypothetical protein
MTPSKKIPFLSYLEPGEYTMLKKYSAQTKTPMTQLMREAVTMRVSSGDQYLTGYNNGITKAIEAVRQLRGEAHPAVQVKDCRLALAAGPGLVLGPGHAHATVILERE